MFRYLAFFWNEADPAAHAASRELLERCRAQSIAWEVALSAAGVVVLCAGATATQRALVLRGSGGSLLGVVLGDLFRAARRCRHFEEEESERILMTRGRELVANFWGNYVALLRDPTSHARWVLRGPAATLPCLHVGIEKIDIYFSFTESCAALNCASFSVNWNRVARSLNGLSASQATAVNEIREIPAGFCEGPQGIGCYWDPVKLAGRAPIGDFNSAAITLHDVAESCVHAWAEGAPRILHALSGGLDSSIVLGCLHSAPSRPEITCLTHFAPGPDSDERFFARCAANRAHRPLVEREQPTDIDLRSVLHGVRFETSPGMRIPEIDRIEPDAALEVGAPMTTKGHGGDELFCRHHTHFYVADFLRVHGLHPDLLPTLLHSAVTEGETLWTILGGALRDALIPRRWNLARIFARDQEGQSLLHADVAAELLNDRSCDAPYTPSTRDCPPGKLWQISVITGRRFHYLPSMREDDPQQVSPLLSQPLIEACLRIPTYLQMKDRRERAVARAAFIREVPREILERRWKGGAEHLAWRLLRRNLSFVRELLLEGHVVRARIVDRPRLEALLDASPASLIKATVPIFHLVGAEAWLQAWVGRGVPSKDFCH